MTGVADHRFGEKCLATLGGGFRGAFLIPSRAGSEIEQKVSCSSRRPDPASAA